MGLSSDASDWPWELVDSAAHASGWAGDLFTNGVRRVFVKVLSPRVLLENLLGVERSLRARFVRVEHDDCRRSPGGGSAYYAGAAERGGAGGPCGGGVRAHKPAAVAAVDGSGVLPTTLVLLLPTVPATTDPAAGRRR